jgi:hypothetical protein
MAKRAGSISVLTTRSLKGPRKTAKRLAIKKAKIDAKYADKRYNKGK